MENNNFKGDREEIMNGYNSLSGLNGVDILLLFIIVCISVQAGRWRSELNMYRNKDKDIYVPNRTEIELQQQAWWKP